MPHTSGWFDAFRENGGPTLYSGDNRTSVWVDASEAFVYLAFSTLLVAFLLVVPGIRKERCTTVFCVSTSLLVGAAMLLGIFGSGWHTGHATTNSYYRAFSVERVRAHVGVHVGLYSVNVTYMELPDSNGTMRDINYNEQFKWEKATSLQDEYRKALAKGLPFPILTMLDYFSQDAGGFLWGRSYRKAGDWAQFLLWAAFTAWLLANVLLCAVPRYGAYALQVCGALMVLSTIVYYGLLPRFPLVVPLETDVLRLTLGWNYYIVLLIGILAVVVGGIMAVVDIIYPSKFATILEVDYDTPYRYFVAQGNQSSRNTSAVNSVNNSPVPLPKYHKMGRVEDDNAIPFNGPSSSGFNQLDDAIVVPSDVPDDDDDDSDGDEDAIAKASRKSKSGIDNAAFEQGSEDGCVMVDGKRAVTLQDFGKFADALRRSGRKKIAGAKRRAFARSMGFSVKDDITINIQDESANK
ncbi:dual oxidase maturation factor 1-like [Ornithodoros turicata]|uniref:dual oxidase maturation factor 1-like n=1 Tax=Ornithodoros turicata TaxID=34597 RepID=UPI003139B0B0